MIGIGINLWRRGGDPPAVPDGAITDEGSNPITDESLEVITDED